MGLVIRQRPGIEPTSPALAGDSLPLSHQGSPDDAYFKKKNNAYYYPDCTSVVFQAASYMGLEIITWESHWPINISMDHTEYIILCSETH